MSLEHEPDRTSPANPKRRIPRNPFPESHWFALPLRLYETGLAAHMSGSQFKRFVTLWRASNFDYGSAKVKLGLEELESADGVSGRTAFQAHTKLQEYGLIQIDRHTRPFTYTLVSPELWPVHNFNLREFHRADRIRVKEKLPPVPWDRKREPPLQ